MWRHIAHSLTGQSHLADGSACQDSHCVRVFGADGQTALLACVADGAGSAKYGEIGSTVACSAISDAVAAHFADHGSLANLTQDDVLRWCDEALARIRREAQMLECEHRQLATTIAAAVVMPNTSVFFQIGDGAIVLGNQGVYGVVFWPQSGEYANTTHFLTSVNYRSFLQFTTAPTRFADVALMTDGLERLALRFDAYTPHPPFFTPLFAALRSADDLEVLREELREFLQSAPIAHRSDDDKTLIIASRDAS